MAANKHLSFKAGASGQYRKAVDDGTVAVYAEAVSTVDPQRLYTAARMQARAAQFRAWADEAEQAPERFVARAGDDDATVEQKRARYTAHMLGKAAHLRDRAGQIEARAADYLRSAS